MKSILKGIGQLLFGLSILNLIDDFDLIKLKGKLGKWLDSYSSLISSINDFLFGWIDFGWINISDRESHLLVIAAILASAYAKAWINLEQKNKSGDEIASGFTGWVVTFSFGFFPALLIPYGFGFALSSLLLLFIFVTGFLIEEPTKFENKIPKPQAVRKELLGGLIVLMAIILFNKLFNG